MRTLLASGSPAELIRRLADAQRQACGCSSAELRILSAGLLF
ncbi:MAG: hypothetical protein PHC83_08625 [Bacteroidales bacterium]|nr:hypothetical protein [Bacteroidales bacterium]MDD4209762.1 hypothetical protein [Bacteroidales bacterium]